MNLFQNYLVEEFAEDYQEGHLTRREALKLIFSVTGSMLLTNSILAACAPLSEMMLAPAAGATAAPSNSSQPNAPGLAATSDTPTSQGSEPAEPASPGEAAIETTDIELPGEEATLLATLSRPAGDGPFPVILVCHENRGLTEHIKDVTRRLAQASYVALAVDLLSRQGGSSSMSPDQVPGALGNTPPQQFVSDFKSGWHYLKDKDFAQADRVGMVGFCFGGGVTWQVATHMPELKAAVPFYGPHPAVEAVPNIQAAVLAIYAGNDQRINQGIPPIEEAMQQNGKIYEKVIYPGVDHAFHNDTGLRYNPEAAQDAWRRTLVWFERYV